MLSGYGAEPLSDDILKRSLTAFSTPTRQEGLKEEGARRIATIIQSCPVTPTEKYGRYMPTTNPAQASCKKRSCVRDGGCMCGNAIDLSNGSAFVSWLHPSDHERSPWVKPILRKLMKGDNLAKLVNMARKGPATKTIKTKVVGLTEPM
ncbi:hypothetical protein GE21DRAFT_1762 [Neurospora crassa]|uniref:Uncharacterized protein n=1 Tax=Neurospora crassa (strain ATCC 24698 / 74-OR23-1A / CBS 708.71 / DSM 1257 / FGSC 987) TaxID=367110 RepID=Q7SFB3_NEUCR|nr:hypothetical protein NCU00934 [Neurospora crassa OR74A]EAA35524.1 hypothetical protein NCU00934 [Neurospora crassa OR74A]KHE81797.1 hypothetical protein GE21DRAFT_1762 [Neurospora crassa]|eukprot:XP_964760.1 hypothetical protein NCU00934 [Neurospora crassa OR74A]